MATHGDDAFKQAAELLLAAIAQARGEGEEIPDWLDEAEDEALALVEG